ncbi:MAG: universal stress protein, partial [Proteobacteria bacterium]|nr:universal stress protein [Pseudomonadota bacterium]
MKILVPVDGSAYSLKAVETACDLAKAQAPATLVLTAVAIQIPELEEGVYIAEKMKAQAEIALAKAKEVAQGKGVTAEMILAIGASPVDEIVQVARDQLVDLIVIGSRGL